MDSTAPPKYIVNQSSNAYLTISEKKPGSEVKIMAVSTKPDTQLWKFQDGFLINQSTGYVLEAPTTNDEVKPNTVLVLNSKAPEGKNDNQKWEYIHDKFICKAKDDLCIWGKDGNVQPDRSAIVGTIGGAEESQKWSMQSAMMPREEGA